MNQENRIFFKFWKKEYFPLYGITNNEWFPLIYNFDEEFFQNVQLIEKNNESDESSLERKIK